MGDKWSDSMQLLSPINTFLSDIGRTLVSICEYGNVRLDNNLIENAVRPTAVGKKNWLFIGAPHAGKRSAVIYTIIQSCQRCGVDPSEYMKDLLRKIPSMTNQDDFTSLLPQNWKPAIPMIDNNSDKLDTSYVNI